MRINRDLATLLIMSAAAEMPNRAALQAKQDAYDQVTHQAQAEIGKQVAEYEEQRRRMAAEHERCLEALRQENQRMVDEAIRVRREYTEAFMASKTPTVEEIEASQTRHHYQTLKEQMAKKEQRLKDENTREKDKRVQKEKELAEAEKQIENLRRELNYLEEALFENGSKRAVPTRSPRDSPVSPDTKRTKMDEPIDSFQGSAQLGPIISHGSQPVLSPFQDQTLQDHTPQIQTFQNHTLQDHTPQIPTSLDHTQQIQILQSHTPQVQTIQNQVSQVQTLQDHTQQIQITSLQTKEIDSDLNPVIPVEVRQAIEGTPNRTVVNEPVPVDTRNAFAESAEKTRAAQASRIESFKRKKKECPEVRNENLYLDFDGDLVEMVSSRSPSAQTRSPCHKITVP
jgi:hypothetical protein